MVSKQLLAIFGFLSVLATFGHKANARIVIHNPGSATQTQVTHFTFLQRLGNPCQISGGLNINAGTFAHQFVIGTPEQSTPTDFYRLMVTGINLAMEKVGQLELADPTLPECNGVYLKSLPATPSFENMNMRELFKSVYQAGIFLAAHLHIMSLDRQVVNGNSALRDDQAVEDPNQLAYVRNLQCGNESSSLVSLIREVTTKIEDILCTLIVGASDAERASFREPYMMLLKVKLYRYHTSCSLFATRDCLVLRETKYFLNNLLNKFGKLLSGTDSSILAGESEELNNML